MGLWECGRMFEKALVMYIYAETPLHPGSGTTISGTVDLPIQRERHTEFPIIQGSSLKGTLRSHAQFVNINGTIKNLLFGEPDRVGGVSITDARVLAFPVRSLKGLFAWTTCPFVLNRFKRDLTMAGKPITWKYAPVPSTEEKVIARSGSNLLVNNSIYLEDLKLNVETSQNFDDIANVIAECLPNGNEYDQFREKIKKDLIIVTDDLFRNFVTMTTDITTRIKIEEEKGTVKEGGLWSEEYIPTDTILYNLILIPARLKNLTSKEALEKLQQYNNRVLHIGGDETIGKGFVRIKMEVSEC